MASFIKSDGPYRLILLLVYLYVLILGILVITVPPGFDPDSGWGFMVMHNMERGAAFNHLVSPDPANIAANRSIFLSWWSPGQYMVPYLLKVLLKINSGHAISLTILGGYLTGLTGFYLFFKKLGFTKLIAALSIAFIATQQFFIGQFVYYNGGELLLFAFLGWFLYGCFSFQRVTWQAVLFIFIAGLLGFFAKSSVLWMLAAGTCCVWVNTSLGDTCKLAGQLGLRRSLTDKHIILPWLKNGIVLFLPLAAACLVISVFYLSKGPNPSGESGHFLFKPEVVGFPLASPLLSGFSVDELMDGLIYQPDGPTVTYHLAIIILFALATSSLLFVWLIIKFRAGEKYLVAFLSFYLLGCVVFGYMYFKQFTVSFEGRHFRIIGLLAIPGIIYLLFKSTAGKAIFFVAWIAFSYAGLRYFSDEFRENRQAARGNLGLSEQLYDTLAMKKILQLDREHHDNAIFVVMSADIGAEITHNRVITIDAETVPNGDFSKIKYKGKSGPLFILVPQTLVAKDGDPSILKSFAGYHHFSSKQLSPDFYLYSAED
jgi:hypothetical protein